MGKRKDRQIYLAQNFLKSPKLVCRLVAKSAINPSDIVYDIGAGKGIITAELARVATRVIAIEKDSQLANKLRVHFRAHDNVEIVVRDFLEHKISERDYKIFANIPYNITARVMRKILYEPPLPSESYLILQKEAGKKFSGRPKETLFSVLAKPFFEFRLLAELRRTDFKPMPKVDSVFLLVRRRSSPLIEKANEFSYRQFVQHGFCRWKPHLKSAYKDIFSYKQWKRLSGELKFPLNATPTELSFEQWLGLFKAYKLQHIRRMLQ